MYICLFSTNFYVVFCFIMVFFLLLQNLKAGSQLIQQLSKLLHFSAVQEVIFTLALRHSSHQEVVSAADTHLHNIVPALVQSYIDTEGSTSSRHEGALHDTTPEILHLILSIILNNPKEVIKNLFS